MLYFEVDGEGILSFCRNAAAVLYCASALSSAHLPTAVVSCYQRPFSSAKNQCVQQ